MELEIRPTEHTVLVNGRVLGLTLRELDLLYALASNPERIMSRPQLYAEAWGGELRADDRSVDVYVSRLRAKLAEAVPDVELIRTHNGIGYRFCAERAHLHLFHKPGTAR